MSVERIFEFVSANRYVYDFKYCTYAEGWAQVDTRQDASYYGTWTNPERRMIFTYCEGDTTFIRCGTDQEYIDEMRKLVAWNKEHGHWLGIDPAFDMVLKQRFEQLGLGDLLH